jgi:monoamine oxidase
MVGREVRGGRLVMGFAGANDIDAADPSAVEAALRRYAPGARVSVSDGHDWVTDPWSKGTWLAWPPGWFTEGIGAALEVPEGRVAFAGSDVSDDGAGWIEGAISSGHRAARHASALIAGGDRATA